MPWRIWSGAGVLSLSSMLSFLAGMVWVFKKSTYMFSGPLRIWEDFRGAWNKRVKRNSLGVIPLLRHILLMMEILS
jgi:hypothetical protein